MLDFSDIIHDLRPFLNLPQIISLCEDLRLLQQETYLPIQAERGSKLRIKLIQLENDAHLRTNNVRNLLNILYETLERINQAFPINDIDPISLISISELPKNEILILSSGHQFHIHGLIQYFNSKELNVFSFENPSTRQAIAFRDCLKIQELAHYQQLQLINQEYPETAIRYSLNIINVISTKYDLNSIQFRALIEVIVDIHRAFNIVQSKLIGLMHFYGLAFLFSFYFDKLNQESSSEPYSWYAQGKFLMINGLPSFTLLALMFVIKNSPNVLQNKSSQTLYFLKMIGFHLLMECVISQLKTPQDEAQFCIRYLSLWMVIAQLGFPRSTEHLQTYRDNLVSGVISLGIEIYRHPNYSAQDFNRYVSSPLLIQLMFGLAKTIIYFSGAIATYQSSKAFQGRFFQNIEELRPLINSQNRPSMV